MLALFNRNDTKTLISNKYKLISLFYLALLISSFSIYPINTSYSIDVFKSASNSQSNENITNSNTTSISPQSYDRLKKC
ncbi:MAG: hypothetical protein ACTHL3_01995, partial [Candidatus Nitrosocosmicus sp.]